MIARARDPRDRALLLTIYAAGLRSAEAAQLRKCDVQAKPPMLTVFGRRRKRRAVRISPATFAEIVRHSPADAHERIFGVSDRHVRRIVKAAAIAAGLGPTVTPHTLRRAHAAHAIDRGCPLPIVQRTLGLRPLVTTPREQGRPDDSSALYLSV